MVPEVLQVVWSRATGTPAPEGLDPGWVAHQTAVYFDPGLQWGRYVWAFPMRQRQRLADFLLARGGRARKREILNSGLNVRESQLSFWTRWHFNGGYLWEPTFGRYGDWNKRKIEPAGVTLLDCPHCGGFASCVVRVPEIPMALLCPDCLRMPHPRSPRFPDSYLDLVARP